MFTGYQNTEMCNEICCEGSPSPIPQKPSSHSSAKDNFYYSSLLAILQSCCFFFFFFFFSFCFLGPHPWHMVIPRLGVELELQLPAYTTAAATPDPSCVCDLHHSSRQCWPRSLGGGSGIAVSCGVGHRCSLDLVLLWLYHGSVAIALRPLA